MVAAITNGIKVSVFTEYQPLYSDPLKFNYAFSYKIRIENNSDFTVQLLSRHWFIFDSISHKYEVKGEGVVGHKPIIEPGDFHEYISGCNFRSNIGKMHGSFFMEKLIDGKKIEVKIPEFLMIVPYRLN
jgi:ApaG protein